MFYIKIEKAITFIKFSKYNFTIVIHSYICTIFFLKMGWYFSNNIHYIFVDVLI